MKNSYMDLKFENSKDKAWEAVHYLFAHGVDNIWHFIANTWSYN